LLVGETTVDQLLQRWETERSNGRRDFIQTLGLVPVVTVSAQPGSLGLQLGKLLAPRLGFQCLTIEHIEAFADGSENYSRIESLLDDQFRLALPTIVNSIALDPSIESDFVRHQCKTILCLAELGGVVLIDWAANYVLGPDCGLHIRVHAPNPVRTQNAMKESGLPLKEARKLLREMNNDGTAYLLKVLRNDVYDETQYDILLNTGHMDIEDLVDIALAAARAKAASMKRRRVLCLSPKGAISD